jgi:beta-galactosidase
VDALGGRVEQYYALEKDVPVAGAWGNGQAIVWAEQLKTSSPDTQVLLRYGKSNGWLDDQPAVITQTYGKGRITYIGAVLDDTLTAAATDWMIQTSGIKPVFGAVPDGVEVSRRRGNNNKDVFVMINFAAETKKITLPRTMKLLLQGKQANVMELPQYGVEVLTE